MWNKSHLNPALQLGLHNAIVLNSNNNSANSSLILALQDTSFHTQWLVWYSVFTEVKLLVLQSIRKIKEMHLLSKCTWELLCPPKPKGTQIKTVTTSQHKRPWASRRMQTTPQIIPSCIPPNDILMISAVANVLGNTEMDRKKSHSPCTCFQIIKKYLATFLKENNSLMPLCFFAVFYFFNFFFSDS